MLGSCTAELYNLSFLSLANLWFYNDPRKIELFSEWPWFKNIPNRGLNIDKLVHLLNVDVLNSLRVRRSRNLYFLTLVVTVLTDEASLVQPHLSRCPGQNSPDKTPTSSASPRPDSSPGHTSHQWPQEVATKFLEIFIIFGKDLLFTLS